MQGSLCRSLGGCLIPPNFLKRVLADARLLRQYILQRVQLAGVLCGLIGHALELTVDCGLMCGLVIAQCIELRIKLRLHCCGQALCICRVLPGRFRCCKALLQAGIQF